MTSCASCRHHIDHEKGERFTSRRLIAVLSLSGATLALLIHLLAIAGYTPLGMGTVFILVLVAIPGWGSLILHANARAARSGKRFGASLNWFSRIPRWGRALFAAAFIYTGINFATFVAVTGGGTLEQRADGKFVLSDHGRFIRELDETGVRWFSAWNVRLFSGHILPFLILPGLYFLFTPSLGEEERPEPRPSP